MQPPGLPSSLTAPAKSLVKGHCLHIPVEHGPINASAAARLRFLRQTTEQRPGDTLTARVLVHEQVFEVEAGSSGPCREGQEPEREAHGAAVEFGKKCVNLRPFAEQLVADRLLGRLHGLQLALIGREISDQPQDGGLVARRGIADREGLVDLRQRSGLFAEQPGAVLITDKVLYRARIRIPARVPVGTYTAETFLIQDGRVVAVAVRDITIRKGGFEQFVAKAAEENSLAYGILAVALSVGLGWGAGAVFRRF